MLTSTSISAAYALATKLADRQYVVRAIQDTPLATLTALSVEPDAFLGLLPSRERLALESEQAPLSERLQTNTLADHDGGAHDRAMDEAVALVSKAVLFTLDTARNTVNPMIQRVVDETTAYITEQAHNGADPLWIEAVSLPAIYSSPLLAELTARYQGGLISQSPLVALNLPVPSNYLEHLSVGAPSYDAEIAQFLETVPAETREQVWTALFNTNDTLADHFGGRRMSETLLAFLLARHASEHIPDGVSNMDLAQWRDYTATLTASLGRMVLDIVDAWNFDLKTSNLIASRPFGADPAGPVVVVAPVYERFVAAGGTPEVIFGAIYGDGERGYQALLDGRQVYERNWQAARGLIQQRLAAEAFTRMVEGLGTSLARIVTELPDDQLPAPRPDMHARIAERLSHAKPSDVDNLFLISRKAVCRVFFSDTDVEQLLIYIDEAAANNPEITDIREIALLGTISYIVSWLAQLMDVADQSAGG